MKFGKKSRKRSRRYRCGFGMNGGKQELDKEQQERVKRAEKARRKEVREMFERNLPPLPTKEQLEGYFFINRITNGGDLDTNVRNYSKKMRLRVDDPSKRSQIEQQMLQGYNTVLTRIKDWEEIPVMDRNGKLVKRSRRQAIEQIKLQFLQKEMGDPLEELSDEERKKSEELRKELDNLLPSPPPPPVRRMLPTVRVKARVVPRGGGERKQ